jgi:hypothetical protein
MRFLTTLGVAAASLLLVTSCSDSGDASDDSSADGSDASAESSTSSDSSDSKDSDKDGQGDDSGDSGGSDDSGTEDEEKAEEKAEKKEAAAREKIRDAARAYSDAFLTGDSAAAFDRLSARCQNEVRDTFGTTVFEAQATYGEALRFESFEAEVTGDSATVTYTFQKSELDKSDESWVLEDLWWKLDDCPEGDA